MISQTTDEDDTTEADSPSTEAATAEVVEELRECSPLTLKLCSHLPYNITAYPNLVGHTSKEVLMRDLVAFRELLDAECSLLAQVCISILLKFFYMLVYSTDSTQSRIYRGRQSHAKSYYVR